MSRNSRRTSTDNQPESTPKDRYLLPINSHVPNKPTSWEDYDHYLAQRADAGNYYLFFRLYLAVMSTDAAVVVQSLLNLGRGTSRDGWVNASRDYLTRQLFMSRRTQDRALHELVSKGFITTRLCGLPARRQVRVHLLAIEQAIGAAVYPPDSDDLPNDDQCPVGTVSYQQQCPPGGPSNDNAVSTNASDEALVPNKEEPADSERSLGRGRSKPRNSTPPSPAKNSLTPPIAFSDNTSTVKDSKGTGAVQDALYGPSAPDQSTPATDGERPSCANVTRRNGTGKHRKAPGQDPDTKNPPTTKVPPPPCAKSEQQDVTPPQRLSEKPNNERPMIDFPPTPNDRKPRTVITTQDRATASVLRDFARKQGWPVSASNANWGEPVAILRRQLVKADPQNGSALLDAVVAWYVGWYVPGKKPTLRNAKELKARWEWVFDLYEKERQKAPPPPENAPDVEFILGELRMFNWPAGSEAQLPAVVAQSYANYRSFYRKVKSSTDRETKVERETLLADCGDPVTYMVNWFRAVWKSVKGWDGWSGDLGRYVWRPDHKDFLRAADTSLQKCTGLPGQWKIVAAALGEEVSR